MHAQTKRVARLVSLSFVLLLFGLWAASSQAQTFSPPQQLTNTGEVPQIAVDPSGNITVVWLDASGNLWLTRSTDGAVSFSTPAQISASGGSFQLAVDSSGAIHLLAGIAAQIFYLHSTNGGGTFSVSSIGRGQGDALMALGPSGSINILWAPSSTGSPSVSRSTDGGATFSTTTLWTPPANSGISGGNEIIVDASENIYVAWNSCIGSNPCDLLFSASTDQGKTYSAATVVGSGSYPAMTFDPSGNLDLVWDSSEVMFRRSADHGASFSSPMAISQNIPYGSLQIAADSKSDLFVTWHVTPNLFFSRSTDGGATFSSPTQLANEYFGEMMAVDSEDNIDIGLDNVGSDGTEQITFVRSTDGGNTFSRPTQISNDTQHLCPTFSQLALEKGGNIDVVWEEFLSPVGATGTPGCDSLPNQVLFSRGIVPNFTISAAPAAQSVLPGGAANFALTLTATAGFSNAVNLSCTNLPPGAACAFNSASITPSGSGSNATLAIATPPTLAQGNYPVTVAAASGDITQTQIVQVAVGGITGSLAPTSATVAVGGSAAFAVALNATNGLTGQVNLACSGAPSGLSCSFSPAQVSVAANGSASSTLTVQVASQPSGSMASRPPENQPQPLSRGLPPVSALGTLLAALLISGVILSGVARRRFLHPAGCRATQSKNLSSHRPIGRAAVLAPFFAVLAVGLISCGGATTTPSNGSNGSTGTSTTGTSGGSGATGTTAGTGASGGAGGSGGSTGSGGGNSVTAQIEVQAQSGGAIVNLGTVSITVP